MTNGFSVSVSLSDDRIQAALGRLTAATGDLTAAFDDIGAALVTSTLRRFETETDPTGRPWRPLSIETIIGRIGSRAKTFTLKGDLRKPAARYVAALKILQHRGHLKGGIHHRATQDGVEVGSDRIYARIHQFGGKAGRGKKVTIPPRPFLGIDRDDEAMMLGILRAHIGRALGDGVA
ncbi:phage virion morphogenesis protein [Azospirillum sp. 11R-A]|uniref:phage virion morphogenesis protein n=1 Tax=Azospirillum sp. 11R-A TaxID=3111634 RepID=UPI003C1F45DE